jgi:hypothetical protein
LGEKVDELIARSVIHSKQYNKPYGIRGDITLRYGDGIVFEFEWKIWNDEEHYIRITREGEPLFFRLTSNLHPPVTNIDSLNHGNRLLASLLIITIIKNMETCSEDLDSLDYKANQENVFASVDVDILPDDEEMRCLLLATLGNPKKLIM